MTQHRRDMQGIPSAFHRADALTEYLILLHQPPKRALNTHPCVSQTRNGGLELFRSTPKSSGDACDFLQSFPLDENAPPPQGGL